MSIKIYNSLGSSKQEFSPVEANTKKLNMYTCGVTVYDSCHIGHGRSLYVFEVIRRYLRFRGYDISLVRNITDVDDKIINKARDWAKKDNIPLKQAFDKVREFYIEDYYNDLESLGLPKADQEPLATENIIEIQEYINGLIDKGFAYAKNGNVYFAPRKLSNYGSLSGNNLDDVLEGIRINDDPDKNDPVDFALWKKVKDDEPSWESPWGNGRPGWHIECSVMSQKYLGVETLDIHGGGRDLIFPHHENEKAQAEALTGKLFAKYWIHHGLLTINGQKMAKSLGNFFTIKDVLGKYSADILKVFYLQAHYSSSIDFSWEKMDEAQKAFDRIARLKDKLENTCKGKPLELGGTSEDTLKYKEAFISAMDDDFNMPKGLAVLFDLVSECNRIFDSDKKDKEAILFPALSVINEISDVFCLTFLKQKSSLFPEQEIQEKINLRVKYKSEKNFKAADEIRDLLQSAGIILEDKKDGNTTWRIA